METLPIYVDLLFFIIVLFTIIFLYRGTGKSKTALYIVLAWLLLQGLIAAKCFYVEPRIEPQHFILLVLPPMVTLLLVCFLPTGKLFRDNCDLKWLTLAHVVRVGVECVLFLLFAHKLVPKLVTFAGFNYDILAGLTAPLVLYFGLYKKKLSNRTIIIWNLVGICLLLTVLIEAILSAPFSFQQFGRDQPNVAVFYFPFIWLPGFIVPFVLFSHLVSIRKLLNR